MRNRRVPRSEWCRFLEEFSRRHEGWLVTLRVLSPSIGSQVEARDLPLEGIVCTPYGAGPISIHVGASAKSNLQHDITEPKQVWVEVSETGAEEALGIVSEGETETILEFRAPNVPENVDGILHA